MADCEILETCLFFTDKMENMPTTAELLKRRFCRSNNSDCARYIVYKALGRDKVPPYLAPNQLDKANEIIAL